MNCILCKIVVSWFFAAQGFIFINSDLCHMLWNAFQVLNGCEVTFYFIKRPVALAFSNSLLHCVQSVAVVLLRTFRRPGPVRWQQWSAMGLLPSGETRPDRYFPARYVTKIPAKSDCVDLPRDPMTFSMTPWFVVMEAAKLSLDAFVAENQLQIYLSRTRH